MESIGSDFLRVGALFPRKINIFQCFTLKKFADFLYLIFLLLLSKNTELDIFRHFRVTNQVTNYASSYHRTTKKATLLPKQKSRPIQKEETPHR